MLACALTACVVRDPLDTGGSATATDSGTSSGSASESSGAEPTSEPPNDPTATTGTGGTMGATSDEPSTTIDVSTGEPPNPTTATTGDPTDPVVPMPSGEFLLAVSTVIDPGHPLQFIAQQNVTVEGDETIFWLDLQPLALAQGQVTQPRTPVGDLVNFPGIPVVQSDFELDAGTVAVPGEANPITGSDIVAALVLRGSFISDDFYCGEVDGEVTMPLNVALTGSTFAAVRIAGLDALPLDVTINCAGDTVTDG